MASKVQDELKALEGGVRARMSKYNEAIKTKREPIKKETLIVGTLDDEKKDVTRYHSPKRAAENKKKTVTIPTADVVQVGTLASLLSTFENLASKSRSQEERDREEALAKDELGKLLDTGSSSNLNTSFLQSPKKPSLFESPTKSVQVLSPHLGQSSTNLNGSFSTIQSGNSTNPIIKSPVPIRSFTFQSVRKRYMQAIKECKPGFSLIPPEEEDGDNNSTDDNRPSKRHPLLKKSVRKVEAEKKDRFVQLRHAWDKYEIIAKNNDPKISNSNSPEEVAIQKQIIAAEDEVVNKWVDYAKAVVAVVSAEKQDDDDDENDNDGTSTKKKKKKSSAASSTDDSTQEETTSNEDEDDEDDDLSYWIKEAKRMKAEADARRRAKEEILKRQAEEQARAEAEAEEAFWLQEAIRLKELNKNHKKSKKKQQAETSDPNSTESNEGNEENKNDASELINPYDDESVDVLAIAAAGRVAKVKALVEASRSRPVAVSGVTSSSSGVGSKPLPAWVKSRRTSYTSSNNEPHIPSGTPFNDDDSDATEIHHVEDDDDVDHHRIEATKDIPVGLLLHQRKKLYESNNQVNSTKVDWKKKSTDSSVDTRTPFPGNRFKKLSDNSQEVEDASANSTSENEASGEEPVHGKKKKVYGNDVEESDIKASKKMSFGHNLSNDDDNDSDDDENDETAIDGEKTSNTRRKKTFAGQNDNDGDHTKERKKKSVNISGDVEEGDDDNSTNENEADTEDPVLGKKKKVYGNGEEESDIKVNKERSYGRKLSTDDVGDDDDSENDDENNETVIDGEKNSNTRRKKTFAGQKDNDGNHTKERKKKSVNISGDVGDEEDVDSESEPVDSESTPKRRQKKNYTDSTDDSKPSKGKKKSFADVGQNIDSSDEENDDVNESNENIKDGRTRKKKIYNGEDGDNSMPSGGKKKYSTNGLDGDGDSSADENDNPSNINQDANNRLKKKKVFGENDDDVKTGKKTFGAYSANIEDNDESNDNEVNNDIAETQEEVGSTAVQRKQKIFLSGNDDEGKEKKKNSRAFTGMDSDAESEEEDKNAPVDKVRHKKNYIDNDEGTSKPKKTIGTGQIKGADDSSSTGEEDNIQNQEKNGDMEKTGVTQKKKKLFSKDDNNDEDDFKTQKKKAGGHNLNNIDDEDDDDVKTPNDTETNEEAIVNQGSGKGSLSQRRKKTFGADDDNDIKEHKKQSARVSGNDADSESENDENDSSLVNNVRKKKAFADEDEDDGRGSTKSKKNSIMGEDLMDRNDDGSTSENDNAVGSSGISSQQRRKKFLDEDVDVKNGKKKSTRGNFTDNEDDEDESDNEEDRVNARKKKNFATNDSDDDNFVPKANKKKLTNIRLDEVSDEEDADVESGPNTDKRKKKVFADIGDHDHNEQKKKNFGRKINVDADDDSDDYDETGDHVADKNVDGTTSKGRRKKQFLSNTGGNDFDQRSKKKYGQAVANDDSDIESDNSANENVLEDKSGMQQRKKKQFAKDNDENHKIQRKKQFGNLDTSESDDDENEDDINKVGSKGFESSRRIRKKKNFADDSEEEDDDQNRMRKNKKNIFKSEEEDSSGVEENPDDDMNNNAPRSAADSNRKVMRKKLFCDDDTNNKSPMKGKKKKSLTESCGGESSSFDESDDDSCSSAESKSKTHKKKKKIISNDDSDSDGIGLNLKKTKNLKQSNNGVDNRTNEGSSSMKDKKKPKNNRRYNSTTSALAGKSLYDDDSDYEYAHNQTGYAQNHKDPSKSLEQKIAKKSPSKGSTSKMIRQKTLSTSSDDGSYQKPKKKVLSLSRASNNEDSDSDDSAPNTMQGMAAYIKKDTYDESYEDASMSDTVPTDDESVKQSRKNHPVVPFQKKKTVDIKDDQVALEQKQLNLDGTYWKYTLSKWLNEPSDKVQIVGTKIIMSVPAGTDFWRQTRYNFVQENAPFHFEQVTGDFEVIVHISGNLTTSYQKAGIMVRTDDGHWLSTGMEYVNEKAYMSMIVTKETSDRTLLSLPLNAETAGIWFCIKRNHNLFELYYSFDSKKWLLARQCLFAMDQTKLSVGVTAASPTKEGLEVTFNYYRCSKNAIWTSTSTAV